MFQPLALRPGIVKDVTPYAAEGGYVDSNLIRFWQGSVESMGGWDDVSALQPDLLGVPRSITTWKTNSGKPVIAVGTNSKLYVQLDGTQYDITPYRASYSSNPADLREEPEIPPLSPDPFTVIAGSNLVAISIPAHGAKVGDYVNVSGATALGNINPNGNWQISEIVDIGTFKFAHHTVAQSSLVGGGSLARIDFEIAIGSNSNAVSGGCGSGTWGRGTWGTPRASGTAGVTTLRTWSLQNWGENLLAMPRGGYLYVWSPGTSPDRAERITTAPRGTFFVLSPTDGHLVVFGAGGDDRKAQWSDGMDYNAWSGGTSGALYLTTGVSFTGAALVGTEILVWDNSGTLYRMRHIGDELVFSFLPFATDVPLLTRSSVVVHSDKAYWLGNRMVYMYDGNISAVQCPVIEYLHKRLNMRQKEKIIGGAITQYGELIWFYPSGEENDSYIKFNTITNAWDIGTLARTAWFSGGAFDSPIGGMANGRMYFHERGTLANGAPMSCWLTTAFTDLDEGDKVTFIRRFMADVEGDIDLTIFTRRTAHGEPTTRGPYRISSAAQPDFAWVRARGRQMAFKFSGPSFWRLGKCQIDYSVEGAQ